MSKQSNAYVASRTRTKLRLPKPMGFGSLAWALGPLVAYLGLRVWRTGLSFPANKLGEFALWGGALLALCFGAIWCWAIYLPKHSQGWWRMTFYVITAAASVATGFILIQKLMQPSMSNARIYLAVPGVVVLYFIAPRLVMLMRNLAERSATSRRKTQEIIGARALRSASSQPRTVLDKSSFDDAPTNPTPVVVPGMG